MTTEALSLHPSASEVTDTGQESLRVDVLRDMVDRRDVANNVPLATTPDDSLIPSFNDAMSCSAKDNVQEKSSSPDAEEKASTSPIISEPRKKIADVSNQQQDGGHSIPEIPKSSSDKQEADDTSSLVTHEEMNSHTECHGEEPTALKDPDSTTEQAVQKEEDCHDTDPVTPVDSLEQMELAQEKKENRDTSNISSNQEQSAGPDISKKSEIVSSCNQPSLSGCPEQLEPISSSEQPACSWENNQADGSSTSSESSNGFLTRTDSPKHVWDKGYVISPTLHSSSALSVESHQANTDESIKPDCHDVTEADEGKKTLDGQDVQVLAMKKNLDPQNGEFSIESSRSVSQDTEEQISGDMNQMPTSSSLALIELQPDDAFCQQRAASTACDTSLKAMPMLSPVATSNSSGPAHQGLAPVCDRQSREGQPVQKSSETEGDNQSEVQAKAPLEPERTEEAVRDTVPEKINDPKEDSVRTKDLAGEFPDLESLKDTSESTGVMVLASVEDSLGVRERADSQDLANTAYTVDATEHGDSSSTPGEILLLDGMESASNKDLVSSTDPIYVTAVSEEQPGIHSGSGCSILMEDTADHLEHSYPTPETPIEKEIRLHLEREELLRRERGLANPRGIQEYIEVRIRPILNQNMTLSSLPKEKERQWAGVQMQREIQRECRREEDLMHLGKVRGAYDRGTPQELQEKMMIFEHPASPDPTASWKISCSSSGTVRGPSFTEANSANNMVILDSSALLRSQWPPQETSLPSSNSFSCLRAKSPQTLLEQEVQEVQERELELQRQRQTLYGSALPSQTAEDPEQEEETLIHPERPSCKKLDFTWPPPSPAETTQVNGLHQVETIPRNLRRQKSALIQRWESGAIGNVESQD